jgi:hypothetical protein
VWLQASAAMQMRSARFWDITQSWMVVVYRRFGTIYLSYLQRSRRFLALENGTDTLSRNVGTQLPLSAAQYTRRAQRWNFMYTHSLKLVQSQDLQGSTTSEEGNTLWIPVTAIAPSFQRCSVTIYSGFTSQLDSYIVLLHAPRWSTAGWIMFKDFFQGEISTGPTLLYVVELI